MEAKANPYLTQPDLVVLSNLFHDVQHHAPDLGVKKEQRSEATTNAVVLKNHDKGDIARLKALNDPDSPAFQPTVFVTWDDGDIPEVINYYVVRPYVRVAKRIVRHSTDVVFLTHILMYLFVNLPSAIWLFHSFTWVHAIAHAIFTGWCTGSFTLLMHNHIHNNGVLAKDWFWLDAAFPYLTEPLMGHTWRSYYHHHVKHHHVEGNGPDDLSSTVRYQRDDLWHFLHYFGRFFLLIWLELPLYFVRKNKPGLALRSASLELLSYAFMYSLTRMNWRASLFVLILPFVMLRIGLMAGNWGQHALVDEFDPNSDYRSSITLIDVPSNRFCFNDGYHTAHHLNPRRHWREQPVHFLQSKEAYSTGRALVFHDIDYLMLTIKLFQKDYMYLAKRLVPIGDQIGMSQTEIAAMLRTKTRRFTEEEIRRKFR